MKVLLAGFNIDADVVAELRAAAPERADVTPETLAAAYARISRNPRPVDELRAEARAEVERARRSNQTIIFKMGHHSVAEHAVFNFDLIGLSRLAIEEVERFRLCSFTEKSQRYITLGDDFVVPAEVRRAGLEQLFVETVRLQNALYHRLYAKLRPHVLAKYPDLAKEPGNQAVLDGWAKEDARYVVSLATEGQLGMTINARNLELLIRRFAAKDLDELRELNQRIYALAKDVAPSIVLFTDPTPFDARTYAEVGEEAARSRPPAGKRGAAGRPRRTAGVRLVDATPDADLKILAALLHTATARPYGDVLEEARRLPPARKKALFRAALQRMEFYDFPLREFEHASLTFELVVSASCFAQLKRHRMATLTWQPYDPALGVTIPPSVAEAGAAGEFREVIERTDAAYDVLKKACGAAAAYVLTNAHRRRVLIHLNARELYHLSRLREDATAQWEIRAVAARMSALARRVMPLAGLLLGGKDAYPELYERIFGARPSLAPPRFLK